MEKVLYNGRMRKLYNGSRGGQYVISSGRKVYLKVKSSKKKAPPKHKDIIKTKSAKKKKSTSGLRMPRMSNLKIFKLFGGNGLDDIKHEPSQKTSQNINPFVYNCISERLCSINVGELTVNGNKLTDKQVKDYVKQIYNSEYKNYFLIRDIKSQTFNKNNQGRNIKSLKTVHYNIKTFGSIEPCEFNNRIDKARNIEGLKLLIVSFLARKKFHNNPVEFQNFKEVNTTTNSRNTITTSNTIDPWKTTYLTDDGYTEYQILHPLF